MCLLELWTGNGYGSYVLVFDDDDDGFGEGCASVGSGDELEIVLVVVGDFGVEGVAAVVTVGAAEECDSGCVVLDGASVVEDGAVVDAASEGVLLGELVMKVKVTLAFENVVAEIDEVVEASRVALASVDVEGATSVLLALTDMVTGMTEIVEIVLVEVVCCVEELEATGRPLTGLMPALVDEAAAVPVSLFDGKMLGIMLRVIDAEDVVGE